MTTKTRLYSPNQVALMSWLVPAAGVLVLARNFGALGNKKAAIRTMLWGGLFVVWFYGSAFFSEPRAPYVLLTYVAFINAAHQIAARCQMSSLAISRSEVFDFRSDETLQVSWPGLSSS